MMRKTATGGRRPCLASLEPLTDTVKHMIVLLLVTVLCACEATVTTAATGDAEAPSTPTNLMVVSATPSTVEIRWDAATDDVGVTVYDVIRDGGRIGTTTSTNYTDAGLDPETEYTYAVAARDAAGHVSDVSSSVSATTADAPTSTSILPREADWTDQGVVVALGDPGEWDARIDGSFTPSTVVKKGGTIFLYYVGADGDRPDGGPANRALGVATSSDGVSFSKHDGNPVIRHQPAGGVEGGIFSAGGFLDRDGRIVVYFGGMEAQSSTSVDGDGVLATSSDGFDFTIVGDVIDHSDSNVYRSGDEIFPVGAFRGQDGTWYSYYIGKGGGGKWDLGLASGAAADAFDRYVEVLDLGDPVKNGGDPIRLGAEEVVVPVGVYHSGTATIQMRTTTTQALDDLGRVARTYDFGDVKEFTMFMDEDLGKWFLYYVTPQSDGIHLRTAPAAR